MKPRAVCHLRRLRDGEVVGEVIGEDGQVLEMKHFGKYTEEEFGRLSRAIRQELPDIEITDIEISEN